MRLVAIVASQASRVTSGVAPIGPSTPALLTAISSPPKRDFASLHQSAREGFVGYVSRQRAGHAARRLDFGNEAIEQFPASRGDDDAGAFSGKKQGNRPPDPGTRSGDDRHLAVQRHSRGIIATLQFCESHNGSKYQASPDSIDIDASGASWFETREDALVTTRI